MDATILFVLLKTNSYSHLKNEKLVKVKTYREPEKAGLNVDYFSEDEWKGYAIEQQWFVYTRTNSE